LSVSITDIIVLVYCLSFYIIWNFMQHFRFSYIDNGSTRFVTWKQK